MTSCAGYGFRRFAQADLPAVQRLHITALRNTEAFIEVDDYYADLDDIPGTYLKTGGEFLVGEVDARIIAMGGLQLHDNGVGELRRMRVAPHMQDKGIGRALLHQLETAAFARGCDRIELDTTINQTAAQHLFVSCGYVELGRGHKGGHLETIFYFKSARPSVVAEGQFSEPFNSCFNSAATTTSVPSARHSSKHSQCQRTPDDH